MSEKVHVVAHVEVAVDAVAQFITTAQRLLVLPTRREPGCLRYELCQDLADPRLFTMIETWTTGAALDAHLAQPSLAAALDELRPLITSAPKVMRLRDTGQDKG